MTKWIANQNRAGLMGPGHVKALSDAAPVNMATNTIKGRVAAGAGAPQDLSAGQALTILKTAGAYAKDNILGTVSQALGVPTGAAFESDINANGTYAKFADGTMMCWAFDFLITYESQYTINGNWTLPAAFSNAMYVGVCNISRVAGDGLPDAAKSKGILTVAPLSASVCKVGVFGDVSSFVPGQTGRMNLFAIGRWP
jgi:hypothetical protein